jgi:[ribosomal protein S5]-alanine N-acetyltransferase
MLFESLETERLVLRNISIQDAAFLFNEYSDTFINRYMYDAEPMVSLKDSENLIDFFTEKEPRNQHRWVLIQKNTNERIGTIGFHCWDKEKRETEVGYELIESKNGFGYMNEAMKIVILFAKDKMKVNRITANIYYANIRSKDLVLRNNFIKNSENIVEYKGIKYRHELFELVL